MRISGVLMCIALAACSVSTPTDLATPAPTGTLSPQRYQATGCPVRDYFVYKPRALPPGPRPLVVYLHGCTQTATEAIAGVRWNELADREGLIVVYPEQAIFGQYDQTDGNDGRCWNWFLPTHQMRDAGETCTIAGITREVMAAQDIDPKRVYVTGISAGGEMTSNMGATYPDLYAAIGVIAGGPYTGADDTGVLAYQAMGEFAQRMPALVYHGTADELAVFGLGVKAVRQWLGTNDWADDGQANSSVPPTPASREEHAADDNPSGPPRGGDTCVRARNSPCPGGALGYQYSYPHTVEHYLDADGATLLEFWIVHGLAHNYAGGDPKGNFVDPLGPDTHEVTWEFFQAHPKP